MNSPFIISQDFLSPKQCEQLISDHKILQPDTNLDGDAIKTEQFIPKWNHELAEKFHELIPEIESRYECEYVGLEQPVLQYFPQNAKTPATTPGCENAKYIRKKWVKYKDIDLVGFIWLNDFNDRAPLDPRFEVFGGKLEFPAYNFSLVPQRGTLVLYPAGPHFITVVSPILVGELYQVKLNVSIKAKEGGMWFYQPTNHPGKWQDWLAAHM